MTYLIAVLVVVVILFAIVAITLMVANESRDRRRATCNHEWVPYYLDRYEWGVRRHGLVERWRRKGIEPGLECPRCGTFKATEPVTWDEWDTVRYGRK